MSYKIIELIDEKEEVIFKYLTVVNNDFKSELNIINLVKYSKKLSEYANVYFLDSNAEKIGMVAVYLNDQVNNIIYISSFSIKREYQKNGWGQILLSHIISLKKQLKMSSIRLEVNMKNIYALNFYKKNNFKILKKIENNFYLMEYK